jgi:hypothetical protein
MAPIKCFRHFAFAFAIACPLACDAVPDPSWWTYDDPDPDEDTRIILGGASESNFSPASIGQLKHVATQARDHLDKVLPGGAGTQIDNLIAGFAVSSPQNFAPATLGQLKKVAKPFYDRLLECWYNTWGNLVSRGYPETWPCDYPWDPNTPTAENYAPVTLGQLRMVFSFDPEVENGTTVIYVDGSSTEEDEDGTLAKPYKTIQAAADAAQAGNKIKIKRGVYREKVELSHGGSSVAPIIFEASGKVTVSGCEIANVTWEQPASLSPEVLNLPGDIYSTNWNDKVTNHPSYASHADPDENHTSDWLHSDLIVVNDRLLLLVDSLVQLTPWRFWIDRGGNNKLYIALPDGLDPEDCTIEYAARSKVFGGIQSVQNVVLRGMILKYASNHCDEGMVTLRSNWTMEDCTIDGCNGLGLRVENSPSPPPSSITEIRRCNLTRHGGLYFGVNADDVTFEECNFGFNNWRGFDSHYGASNKVWTFSGVVIRNCRIFWNCGPGIWFDMSRSNHLIEGCEIFGNYGLRTNADGTGIFIEATYGEVVIQNNRIHSNTGIGVYVAESGGAIVNGEPVEYGVKVIGNRFARNQHPFGIRLALDPPNEWRNDTPNNPSGVPGPGHIVQGVSFTDNIVYETSKDKLHYPSSLAGVFISQDTANGQSAYFQLDLEHVNERNIKVDRNQFRDTYFAKLQSGDVKFAHVYATNPPYPPPPASQTFAFAGAQQALGWESETPAGGRTTSATFDRVTVPSYILSNNSPAPPIAPFSSGLLNYTPGDYIIVAFRRDVIKSLSPSNATCNVFDMDEKEKGSGLES